MKTLDYLPDHPDTGGWKARHHRAIFRALQYDTHKGPFYDKPGMALARSIQAWLEYAQSHKDHYGSTIGEDYVLGPAWYQWGEALRTLLNGETGELDCGTLDSIIFDNLTEQGWKE